MTPQEIENLTPGAEADAAVERHFFGYSIYKKADRDYFDVDEKPDDPSWPIRPARELSTSPDEALAILEAAPGWQIWHDMNLVCVKLGLRIMPSDVVICGVGRDVSFPMAICKAALLWVEAFNAWKAEQSKPLDHTSDQVIKLTAKWANQATPQTAITLTPEDLTAT